MKPSRARSLSLLLSVVGGGIVLMFTTQPWLHAPRLDGGVDVSATGADLLPALVPVALATTLLVLVLTFVPATIRRLLAIAGSVAAFIALVMCVMFAFRPESRFQEQARFLLGGVSGDVSQLLGSPTLTALPWVVTLGFALLFAGLALAALTSPRWADRGQVAQAASARATKSAHAARVDAWDEISAGDDPTVQSDDPRSPR